MHTLTGQGAEVSINLAEELCLADASYEVALKSLYTSNTIPNITSENNKLRIWYPEPNENSYFDIVISEGMYEYNELLAALNSAVLSIDPNPNETIGIKKLPSSKTAGTFHITLVKSTLRTKLKSTQYTIDFDLEGSIAPVLGFRRQKLERNQSHTSPDPFCITNVNVIRVECNIAKGAFLNGMRTHSIYDFYPKVPPGYKIVEQPLPLIYYPITLQSVNTISICLKDQSGKKIDLRTEHLSVTLHIRAIE